MCISNVEIFYYSFISYFSIYFWPCCVAVAAPRPCHLAASLSPHWVPVVVRDFRSWRVGAALTRVVASLVARGREGFRCSSSRVLEHKLSSCGMHWLSCSAVYGTSLNQGWNLCLLNQHMDSLPLSHQGIPARFFVVVVFF